MPRHADYSRTSDLLLFRDSAPAPAVARASISVVQWRILPSLWAILRPHFKEFTKSAGSRRRALLRWVQIALKPASKALGLHRVIIRGKGLNYMIADSAFKRMQVDARSCQLDTDERHPSLALRTSGALNCNEWNDGRQALRLGHDASLE